MCVHILLLSLLMVSILGSPVCKCSSWFHLSSSSYFSPSDRTGSGTSSHSKGIISLLQPSLSILTIYLSSSSSPVMAIIIWSLVIHFIISRVYLTFLKAVILILKHATILRLSDQPPKSALTQVELNYQVANIDLEIQQYLEASSQQRSVELSMRFIMATEISKFIVTSGNSSDTISSCF